MHDDKTGRQSSGPALHIPANEKRSPITRPLDLDDLAPDPPVPAARWAAPREAGGGAPAAALRTTRQLGPGAPAAVPHLLRPVQIILEPSYVPMAPSRPDAIEAFMPAGVLFLRPWRGEVRQMRISEANAVWLHGLAVHAMSVPPSNPPTANLGVVPTTLILRYEGFAHRWTVDGSGQPLLNALIKALLELAGHDLSYNE
jgi:hypothetical protein